MNTKCVAIAMVLAFTLSAALAQSPPKEQPADREKLYDELDEARTNVELLTLELDALRNQAQMQVQMLVQRQWMGVAGFGMGGMMGGGMRGGFPPLVDAEEVKKQGEAEDLLRQTGYEALKKTIVDTSRKLRRERRKVAELEERLNERPTKAVDQPDLDRRLKNVEQKLDRILKELEASKTKEGNPGEP